MPNLEKESEANSLSAEHTVALSSDDLAKLVRQRLDSFQRAGLTHLPKGNGELEFEIAASAPTTELQAAYQTKPEQSIADSVGADTPVSNSACAAKAVQEAGPQYRNAEKPESAAGPAAASPVAAPSVASGQSSPTSNAPSQTQLSGDYGPSLPVEGRITALKVLQDQVAGCTRCDELAGTRSQTVFGVGNPSTRLVLLGEGPGAEEDRIGEPFVGAAGQLLDKIISACTLSRSDVYILNAVKCRPPGNRNPSQSELTNCWGYAERQLEILQPEFICCLGSVAARTLLQTTLSIGKLRRQFHSYRGSRVLVTYHPAYLLRTPSAKKHVWEDMKLLMKELGVNLSK